jgi:hypothetical protein
MAAVLEDVPQFPVPGALHRGRVPAAGVGVTREALLAFVRDAVPADIPALRGLLVEAETILLARLHQTSTTTTTSDTATPDRFLTVDEAAAIAQVPVKRVYEWARGKRWASRPTRRCFRVQEAQFRAWLRERR